MDGYRPCMLLNTRRKLLPCTADCERVQQARRLRRATWAALRDARLQGVRLDDITSTLQICADRLFGDTDNLVYECRVSAGDALLADGRITIMLRT